MNVYGMVADLMHHASEAYNSFQKLTRFLDEKTDNTIGRITGAAYYAKTLRAVGGAFKDVDMSHLADLVRDPAISLKDKIIKGVSHVADKFSHESTVAAGIFAGKGLVIAPVAIGVATMVSMAAPVSSVVAAGVATTGLTKAAMYYLATHHGHMVESLGGKKADELSPVRRAAKWLFGIRTAATGEAPEYGHMAEIGDKMEAEGNKLKAHAAAHGHEHKEDHGHGHDHGHHHESLLDTLKKDAAFLFAPVIKPAMALYNLCKEKKMELEIGRTMDDKAGSLKASRFTATALQASEHTAPAESAQVKPRAHQPMKPA